MATVNGLGWTLPLEAIEAYDNSQKVKRFTLNFTVDDVVNVTFEKYVIDETGKLCLNNNMTRILTEQCRLDLTLDDIEAFGKALIKRVRREREAISQHEQSQNLSYEDACRIAGVNLAHYQKMPQEKPQDKPKTKSWWPWTW